MDDALLAELLARWGRTGDPTEPLDGGEVKHLFLVGDGAQRAVLRVYPQRVAPAAVAQELAWTEAIAASVAQVPRAIPTVEGELSVVVAGRCAVLSPFIAGSRPDRGSLLHRRSAAAVLAAVHAAGRGLPHGGLAWQRPLATQDWERNEWWDLRDVEHRHAIEPLRDAALRLLERLPQLSAPLVGLPTTVLHGDFHGGNLLADGAAIVGVVDWDWVVVDHRVLDVWSGARSFLDPTDPGAVDRVLDFLGAYDAVGAPLSRDERRALPDVIRLKALWTALYDLGRKRLDVAAPQYRSTDLERTLQLADALGRSLEEDG